MKKVSVAIASYNGEEYLQEQLLSILRQTRKVDEIIICDDASTDLTCSIVQDFINEYPEYDIQLFQNETNIGYKENFRQALKKTSGDYIFLCDQDDEWFDEKVEKMVGQMNANSKILALASSFVYMNDEGKRYTIKPIHGMSNNNLYIHPVKKEALVEVPFEDYYTRNFFQGCSLVIRKELKDEVVNHFSSKIHHDWFINMTAAKHHGMYFWNIPLFAYRIHAKNAVGIQGTYSSTSDHIEKANSLEVRTQLPREGLIFLEALQDSDPVYYSKNLQTFSVLKDFYLEHIEALENGDVKTLLKENTMPQYRHMKTKKARVMDLIFAMQRKLK